MKPAATVVIPTFNRARYLERALLALERQDVAPGTFDVVVVDDGSTDGTGAVLSRAFSFEMHVLRQPNAGPGAARNAAVRRAAGELIIFIDDDVIPPPDLVRVHLAAQREARRVVTGRMLSPDGLKQPVWAEWEARKLQRQYGLLTRKVFTPTPRQFFTANASVHREDLLRAGLFDPDFRRAEDVELAYRLADLGLTFHFVPEAVVVHDTPRTLGAWLRVAEQYGRYDIVMWRERGRAHILGNIAEELHYARHGALPRLARAAAGRGSVMRALRRGGGAAIAGLSAVRARRLALATCSVVFNLLYLHGACEELGGRDAFWPAIERELRLLEPAADAAAG